MNSLKIRSCFIVALLLVSHLPAFCATTIADEYLLVPGKSVGKVSLGMTPDAVIEILGKPDRQQPPRWVEYSQNGALLDVFFRKGTVAEIRFGSKKYKTADGMSLANFNQKKWQKDFEFSRLQWRFMNTRYQLKSGGLNFYRLNLDSTDPKNPIESLGLVYDGNAVHEPVSIEGEKEGGWEAWDGSPGTLWDNFKRHILPTGFSNMLPGG